MVGAVHFVETVMVDLTDNRLTVDIEPSEIVLAIRIVSVAAVVEGGDCSSHGSDLCEFLCQID
jgi:hypothetical protein